MKLTCCISNAPIQISGFNKLSKPLESVKTYHPIFNIKLNDLVTLKTSIEENEQPLYLLAILNNFPKLFSMGFTNYEAINKDTTALIPRLLRELDLYHSLALLGKIQLPKFNVTTENINCLKAYLVCLNEAMIEYNQAESLRELKAKEAKRELARNKLIKQNTKGFSSKLTKWLLAQLEIDTIKISGANRKDKRGREYNYLYDYWYDLFKDITDSPANCFLYYRKDLDELYDFILEHIPNDNDNSLMIFTILNKAVKEYDSLGLDVLNMTGEVESNTNNQAKQNNHSEWLGKPIPTRNQFNTNVDFLLAKAKWSIANNAKVN